MGRSKVLNVYKKNGSLISVSDIQDEFYNGVIFTDIMSNNIQANVESILSIFQSKSIPFTWWLFPSTLPKNLGEYLSAHGLHFENYPAMIIDLATIDSAIRTTEKLRIERVKDKDMLRKWVKAFALGFESPPSIKEPFYELNLRLGFDEQSPLQNYAGIINDNVVATSTLFTGAGIASIWGISTLKSYRRKGIGKAMTRIALAEAKNREQRTGALFSSEDGFDVYKEIGFREIFKVTHYLRKPVVKTDNRNDQGKPLGSTSSTP